MPDLADRFAASVEEALEIVASTEVLWLTAPPASAVRQHLRVDRLQALYESIFLRVFSTWENFLEEVSARYLAGYSCDIYTPIASSGSTLARTIVEARGRLYGGRRFLLWHDPIRVADRTANHLDQSPVEVVCRGEQILLEDLASIRHHIAHAGSRDSLNQFRTSAQRLTGNDYRGQAGRLLRSPDFADPLNQPKWIRVFADRFIDLARRVVN